MPELPVDASKFAGMSEEQALTFPRRNVVGVELSDAQISAMPKMISTDAHVMEPDALWQELTPRLREHLPKVPFRNNPPGATDPKLRLRDQDTDGVAAEIPSSCGRRTAFTAWNRPPRYLDRYVDLLSRDTPIFERTLGLIYELPHRLGYRRDAELIDDQSP